MKQGDKVQVIAEWLPKGAKGARGTVQGRQVNGEIFYKILWKHTGKHGNLFAEHELRVL